MLPIPTATRLDPRVLRTRQLLRQAFTDLAQEKSCDLTVREITERAGINRATFYAHFKNFDEFMGFVVDEVFRDILAARLPADAGFSPANVKHLGLAVHESMAMFTHPRSSGDTRQISIFEARVQQYVYRILLEWLGSVPVRPNERRVHPKLKAAALSWSLFGVAMDWDRMALEQPIGEALDQLAALAFM